MLIPACFSGLAILTLNAIETGKCDNIKPTNKVNMQPKLAVIFSTKTALNLGPNRNYFVLEFLCIYILLNS